MKDLTCPECGYGIRLEIVNPWTGDAPKIEAVCDDNDSHRWDEEGIPVKRS